MPQDFAAKLSLVLKALMLSRAQLAQALSVDKSLVGRWASGKVTPSSHNFAALTRYVAGCRPGFTMLDWDREMNAFAERIGVEAPASDDAENMWIAAPILAQSAHSVKMRGQAYEGFWRSTRPSQDLPGRFIHDVTLIRSDDRHGRMTFRTSVEGVVYDGWSMLLQHQFFSVSMDSDGSGLMFSIFNGVARDRPQVMDGLTLATLRDAGGSPAAAACLLERIGELTGDEASDEARLAELARAQRRRARVSALAGGAVHGARPMADALKDDVQRRLTRPRRDRPSKARRRFDAAPSIVA